MASKKQPAAKKPTGNAKWAPKRPAPKPKAVGTGGFPLPENAEKRLEPQNSLGYPGSPVPLPQQIDGSESIVTPQRLYYHKLTRFSPIRLLTPELLGQYIDLWEQGYIRWFSLMQWYIAQRDPILSTVIPKRNGAVKRLKWQIMIDEDIDDSQKGEAEKHKEALFHFYQNVRSTSAVDLNLNSGMAGLIEQMMTALAYKWAVHEIIWKPNEEGLSARFNFVPLWFFENRTGKLRFTETDYQIDGRDLKEGNFMITTGAGLMEPCAVSYLYKSLALKWWLAYIEGHAVPLKVGTTNAARNTPNWKAMERALTQAVEAILLSKDETIAKVDIAAAGELPYIPMVEEMNRMMATLWRGSDLSTMSAKASNAGQGALLQGKEEYFLQIDDAARLNETFNLQIDPQVIGWTFGEGTRPLAYFKLVVPPNLDATNEIAIVNALISWGLADDLGKNQMREHFGVAKRHKDDEAIEPLQPAAPGGAAVDQEAAYKSELESANEFAGEEALLRRADKALAKQTAEVFAPLRDRVRQIIEAANEDRTAAYRQFRLDLPSILRTMNANPANAKAFREVLTSGWFLGLAKAARGRGVVR